jgi:hypothetical protein
VLRVVPTVAAVRHKRAASLAAANAPGGRRSLGAKKAADLQARTERSVAPPVLEAQMALEIPVLIGQYDVLESQMKGAEAHLASLLDHAEATDHPRGGASHRVHGDGRNW